MPRKTSKIIAIALSFVLFIQQSGFAQVAGQLDISGVLTSLHSSLSQDKFRPLHLRYLSYDNLNNSFNLLLDKGDFNKGLSLKGAVPEEQLKEETKTLLNYFFIGISLPNDSFWVNLRPDSPDDVIDPLLATTDVGKILLEADLQLKKDTAQATSPETPEGKDYWEKLYKKAEEIFGSSNITIPTLTRPWIVPGEIIIRETPENAYIYKATLKVMLEQDYLKGSTVYNFSDERLKALNEYSSQLIRELIIPKLTKDVNNAKRYAPLRQVYYSLILSQWFKARFYGKGGLYSWLIDKKNLNGLTSKTAYSVNTYFTQYKKSFAEGEYNIKEPTYTPFGQTIRSYMSGGVAFQDIQSAGSPITSQGRDIVERLLGRFLSPLIEIASTSIQTPFTNLIITVLSRQKQPQPVVNPPTPRPLSLDEAMSRAATLVSYDSRARPWETLSSLDNAVKLLNSMSGTMDKTLFAVKQQEIDTLLTQYLNHQGPRNGYTDSSYVYIEALRSRLFNRKDREKQTAYEVIYSIPADNIYIRIGDGLVSTGRRDFPIGAREITVMDRADLPGPTYFEISKDGTEIDIDGNQFRSNLPRSGDIEKQAKGKLYNLLAQALAKQQGLDPFDAITVGVIAESSYLNNISPLASSPLAATQEPVAASPITLQEAVQRYQEAWQNLRLDEASQMLDYVESNVPLTPELQGQLAYSRHGIEIVKLLTRADVAYLTEVSTPPGFYSRRDANKAERGKADSSDTGGYQINVAQNAISGPIDMLPGVKSYEAGVLVARVKDLIDYPAPRLKYSGRAPTVLLQAYEAYEWKNQAPVRRLLAREFIEGYGADDSLIVLQLLFQETDFTARVAPGTIIFLLPQSVFAQVQPHLESAPRFIVDAIRARSPYLLRNAMRHLAQGRLPLVIGQQSIGFPELGRGLFALEPLDVGNLNAIQERMDLVRRFAESGQDIPLPTPPQGAASPLAESKELPAAASPINQETNALDPSLRSGSTPVANEKLGGVDFRGLPIVTQPMGSSPLGTVPLVGQVRPLAGRVPVAHLDAEWREIENMLNSGIIPSTERIKEYLQFCCQKQDFNQEIDKVLSCLADILRLEEERVSSTEPALKEILVLLESDKPMEEFQPGLSKISVEPKEPKLLEQ